MRCGYHTSQTRFKYVGAESCNPLLTVTSHLYAAGNWVRSCEIQVTNVYNAGGNNEELILRMRTNNWYNSWSLILIRDLEMLSVMRNTCLL